MRDSYRGDVDASEFLEALGLGGKGAPKPGAPPLTEAFSGAFPDPADGMGGLNMESENGGGSSAPADLTEALLEFAQASKRQVAAAQALVKAIQSSGRS